MIGINYTIKKDGLASLLIGVFFVLSFYSLTYKLNMYILFSLFLYLYIFLSKPSMSVILASSLLIFSGFYFYSYGAVEAYRWVKTFLLIIPLVYICNNYNLKPSLLLDFFIKLCACLVYLEFIFFILSGHGFIPDTTSTFSYGFQFLRYKALFEDSNFYSYAVLVYLIHQKIAYGKYNFFLLGSVFLSLSVSAIAVLIFSLVFYGLYLKKIKDIKLIRPLLIFGILLFGIVYYFLVFNVHDLVDKSENEFVRFKLVSLSLRFEAQKGAVENLLAEDEMLLGMGAGSAKLSNERGMNFHNTFLQAFYEMGSITLGFIIVFVGYILLKIEKSYLPILTIIIMLSVLMEVFYFPLLIFVYYLSKINQCKVKER